MESPDLILRWAVCSMDGRTLGELVLLRQDTHQELLFHGTAPSPLDLENIKEAIRDSPSSENELSAALEKTVRTQGFQLSQSPPCNFRITMAVNFDHSVAATRVEPTHDSTLPANASMIGSDMHAAVLEAFDEVNAAIGNDAAALIETAPQQGAKFVLENLVHLKRDAGRLIELLRNVDRSTLTTEAKRVILDAFIALATWTKDFATLLTEIDEGLALSSDPAERRRWLLAKANGEGQAGRTEVARALLELLLNDADIDVNTRAWALRALSCSMGMDQGRWIHEERAGDAFLEAGANVDAAISYLAVAEALQFEQQVHSLELTQRVVEMFSNGTPLDDELRASVLHLHAVLLLQRNRPVEALNAIEQAVSLRSRLLGNSAKLWSSLQTAADAAAVCGDSAKADSFRARAAGLQRQLTGKDVLRNELTEAIRSRDAHALADVREKAKSAGHIELAALADIVSVVSDSTRPHEERIFVIEKAQQVLTSGAGTGRSMIINDEELIGNAFAEVFSQKGDIANAVRWYQRILEVNPAHPIARQNAVVGLMKLGRWNDVIRILERQLRLFGDRPGMLLALSEAFLATSRPNDAIEAVRRGLALNPQGELKSQLTEILSRAVQSGGDMQKPAVRPPDAETAPGATLQDIERCLIAFRDHVERDRRMEFWRRAENAGAAKHTWISGPEALAKSMLWAYLEGTFRGALEILEEVRAGAGRIDLYIRLRAGERVVVELKMLGNGYSSTYAAEGIDQLGHYMDSKKTKLGYLLAFDARSRDQGKALSQISEGRPRHIQVLMFDVRPTVIGRA